MKFICEEIEIDEAEGRLATDVALATKCYNASHKLA